MPIHDWTLVEAGTYHDFHLAWIAELQKVLNQGGLPNDHYALAEYHSSDKPPYTDPKVSPKGTRRTVTVRHVNGHRIVAFIELVEPATKSRESVAHFTTKVIDAIKAGIHILLVDPFPPGTSDPLGMHGAVWQEFSTRKITQNQERPLTLAAYAAGKTVEAFVNHLAVGDELPEMPVFLTPKKYVPLSLESTYMAAYAGMPEFWRKVIEKRPA